MTTAEDTATSVVVPVTAASAASVQLSVVVGPSHGTLTGQGPTWTYTPEPNYAGPDSATVRGEDSNGSATAQVTITITAVNDAPSIALSATTVTYVEASAAVALAPAAAVTDVDNGALPSATIQITTGCSASADVLALAAPPAGITAVYDAAACKLTLTGSASTDAYQQAVRAITYRNTSSTPSTAARSVQFSISDGAAAGTASLALTVQAVEDVPPVAVADLATVAEASTANVIDVLANDTDVDGGVRTVASVGQPAHGTATVSTAGLSVSYTPIANYCNEVPNAALDSFTYTLTGGSAATVSIKVTCTCGLRRPTDFIVGSN